MLRRKVTSFTPKDSFERMVVSAINTNKLQNFLFDNREIWTYDLLRRLFKTIIQLGPIKKRLADQQLRSRYLNYLSKAYYKLNKNIPKDKQKDYSHKELN
jgi:transcriptional regulator with AAA-type ATPase domain